MSYRIAWDTLNLRMAERPAHTEYCTHHPLMERITGLKKNHPEFTKRFYELWQIDFAWITDDGPVSWKERGRTTDMGHAVFLADGSDFRTTIHCPFKSVEEVLAFDAIKEYGLPDMNELTAYYKKAHADRQAAYPEVLIPGGYYKTIISGLIQAFGWERLLEAAAYRREFERVIESFYQLTLHHYKAWAKTDIKVFLSHDDMVWSEGAFLHPDFYRSAIFPRYQKLWQILKDAGKIVLFCSDGNFTEFVDDIARGVDGMIFEPMTSLDYVVERYGRTHVIVSSKVDCRTLTFGTRDQIRAEIDATLKLCLPCPGFIFAIGNHIPSNVPIENALFYFDYLSKHWRR